MALPHPEPPYPSLLVINCLALFAAEAARGLTLPSAYLYASILAPGNGLRALAWGASLFSCGRLAASLAFGWWASSGAPYRRILLSALALQAVAFSLYAAAALLPTSGGVAEAALLLARAALGFFSGTLSTTRAVLAEVTPAGARTRAFAWLSLAKFVGFALTPAVGLLFGGAAEVVQCTAPAWAGVALCLACAAGVAAAFPTGLRAGGDGAAGAAAAAAAAAAPARRGAADCGAPAAAAAAADDGDATACQRATAAWGRPTGPILILSTALFLFLNFATKGAIAVAEAALAPSLEAAQPEGPAEDALADTVKFSLALGLAGLVVYAGLVAKPKAAAAAGRAAGARQWAAARAAELDVLLLLAALLATAAGAALSAPAAAPIDGSVKPAPGALPRLAAGFALLWSVGSPLADVLTVSLYSSSQSALGVGVAQAALLGYMTAAGALGRIALPPLIPAAGVGAALGACAALAAAGAALTAAYYCWLPGAAARAGGDAAAAAHGSPFAPNGLLNNCCCCRQCCCPSGGGAGGLEEVEEGEWGALAADGSG